MNYSINQLAKIAGISVRTLQYYDEIGLVTPSRIETNSYRSYNRTDLEKLQQILFFRELKLPLKKIKEILSAPNYNKLEILQDQFQLIKIERNRLNKILNTINKTISKQGAVMSDQELYGGLSTQEIEEYTKEASERWGKGTVDNSWKKIKSWNKSTWAKTNKEHEDACKLLTSSINFGPDSREAQRAIAKHYSWLNKFGKYNLKMYKSLGKMYSQDPRFAATYAKYHPNLPEFITEAISYYCDNQNK